jgi:protein pelota
MNLKKGVVKVVPESLDDLWHLYNLIYPNDMVYARTTREVKTEEEYARPQKGKRISVFIGLKVEKIVWDKALDRLRVQGVIFDIPENIGGKGSHHTINVTVDNPITIVKPEWLKHQIDRLERASKTETTPIIVISIDDEEFCIATLRQYGIDIKVEEKAKLPRKIEAEKRSSAMNAYFEKALTSLKEVWTNLQSPIVIIGLGFLKNDFAKYVNTKASDISKAVIDIKSVNSSGAAGIQEALRSGILTKALKHVRIVQETKLVEELLESLGKGKTNVTYGLAEVEKADGYGAIEKLIIADTTLREASEEERIKLENLMKSVEEKKGQIVVVSTEHEAGTKLQALSGIAALLRFSIT